jgi:HK97 family phage portal protein
MKASSKKPGRVKAALLNWMGIPIHLTDSDFWGTYFGGTSNSGVTVDENGMLSLSAVWACARLISETIGTLPLSMYERTSSGKRLAPQHPLHSLIHDQPNADATASVHWESTVAAMLLRGAARAEKLLLNDRLIGLQFLAPTRLSATRLINGQIEYRYTEVDGRQRIIPESRIWTIPGFSLDGKNGVSVIRHGANVFGSAIAADTAASKTFKNGLHPTIYYKMEKFLTPQQRVDFRENLKEIAGAMNAGKSPLLEGGMEADTIGINPKDAQLLESRAFSVEEICRWFRVPPFMVGHGEKSSAFPSSIEQQMIGFLTFTLSPWLRRIEQAISKDLLSPVDRLRYYPKFSVEGLLRADSAGRAAFYGAMVDKGIYTRDEVRELEEREPMGGNAAALTVQSAMTTLDAIGQQNSANQARAALRSFLEIEDTKQD